jgi:hypothetical protein
MPSPVAERKTPSRCLDLESNTDVPNYSSLKEGELPRLPLPFERLPSTVMSLKDCASHQIQTLLSLDHTATALLSPAEEDALDDGFVLCNLIFAFTTWSK